MEQWVKAARAGDAHAWSMLHHHHYPSLYAHALTLCRKIDVAKDAVQEAFVTAFLKLDQLKDDGAFAGWIKKILIHICYRTLHVSRRHNDVATLPDTALWEDRVNRQMEHIAADNRLHTALAALPDMLRSTMMLRYFSGFGSYEQIASVLSIPIGTVRSRINQAKQKLAEHWQQHEDSGHRTLSHNRVWNQFYTGVFANVHRDDHAKGKLLNHLQKDLEVVYTSGKRAFGRQLIEHEVHADREHGSWMEPVNVVSSGSVSVIEAKNFNSAEYPDRCPPSAVFVLFRDKGETARMHFHLL